MGNRLTPYSFAVLAKTQTQVLKVDLYIYIELPNCPTVNVEIFDARKFRALWTGPIILNFRAH